ncbi:hypothetical protein HanRHA438_Chr12g0532361 [Helianthus annuus]|nr:hypothetical protein HanRHA438_Chr12g0532361 [Helianthus annuus]
MFKFQIQFLQILTPIQNSIPIPKHSVNQTPPYILKYYEVELRLSTSYPLQTLR